MIPGFVDGILGRMGTTGSRNCYDFTNFRDGIASGHQIGIDEVVMINTSSGDTPQETHGSKFVRFVRMMISRLLTQSKPASVPRSAEAQYLELCASPVVIFPAEGETLQGSLNAMLLVFSITYPIQRMMQLGDWKRENCAPHPISLAISSIGH